MKDRNISKFTVLVLLFILVGISGCDRITSAQIVGEKKFQEEEKKTSKGEPILTVPQQVQAPKEYRPEVEEDIKAEDGHTISLSIKGEAPVSVPQVEAIRTKKVTRSIFGKEQAEQWLSILSKGQEIKRNTEEGLPIEEESVTIDGVKYRYYYSAHKPEEGIFTSPSFQWSMRADGAYSTRLDGMQKYWAEMDEAETLAKIQEAAENLLKQMGLDEFQIMEGAWRPFRYMAAGEESKQGKMVFLKLERMVDGVPVTYYNESACPFYTASGEMGNTIDDTDTASWWEQEKLFYMAVKPGEIWRLGYENPLEITEASDEKLFLLPFEEIRKIFEDTMIARLQNLKEDSSSMDLHELILQGQEQMKSGSLSKALVRMEYDLKKVQLGYMRIRTGDSLTEGTLIPVWDFFGTWKAATTMKNGNSSESAADLEDVPLLTIDARDGTVIQRMWGY